MMPHLVSSSSFLSFLFLVIIIIYFPSHPCIARKSLANKQTVLNKLVLYFSTDLCRAENYPKQIANRSIQDFNKEKNDIKVTFSDDLHVIDGIRHGGSKMIGSDLSPSTLPHSRLLKAAKTKGARWSTTHEIHVASHTGNKKNLYGDIIEMDYDPPHRNTPIHN